MQLRKEETELSEEKGQIEALLASERKQWKVIAHEIRDTKKKYGPETKIGKRRTRFEAPPQVEVDLAESFIEREPITVLLSRKGWIRAMKGHVADVSTRNLQGRRQPADLVLRRDDLENPGAGERRQDASRSTPPSCPAGARSASRCG